MKHLKQFANGLAQTALDWPHPLLIVDSELRIRYVNDAAASQFGYTKSELIDSSIYLVIQEDYRSVLNQKIKQVINSGKEKHKVGLKFSTVVQFKNGNVAPVSAAIADISSDSGKAHALIRFEEIHQDVNDKQAINKLLENASLGTETINALDVLDDPVVIFDKDWRYLFVNEAGWAVLKREKSEVLGKNVWELLPHLEKSEFKKTAIKAMKTQQRAEIEEYYPHRQEWYVTKFYPSISSLITQMKNITDLKKAQNTSEQLLGDFKQAMEVYWDDANKERRKKS